MGEMFEDVTMLSHVTIEHGFTIILIADPQNMVMRPRDDLNGVELDKSEAFDQVAQVKRAGRGFG